MDGIFRLSSTSEHDPAIERWLLEQRDGLRPLAASWFARLRHSGDDVRELFHDGRPTACVGDAAFAYVGVYKEHVTIGFFYGAELNDPAGLLKGTGKHMRHIKLRPADPLDANALERLITSAYDDVRRRLGA